MASASAPTPKLVLEPNVPQLIALKFRNGKECESRFSEEKQIYYSLVDGRGAYLPMGVSNAIANLNLGVNEPFYICKYWNGDKKQRPRINVWLTPESEKSRADEEAAANVQPVPPEQAPDLLERQLVASLAEIQKRRDGLNLIQRRPPVEEKTAAPSAPAAGSSEYQQPWSANLLQQTNALISVYAQACEHASELGVPPAVVRTVMISAFIGLQKGGNR